MNLIQLIKDNNYTPTQADVEELKNYLQEIWIKNQIEDSQFKYSAIIKEWGDYDENYHFHSPPDCLYHPDGRSIHASIIEYLGGKEFKVYKNNDKLFVINDGDIVEIEEWNLNII